MIRINLLPMELRPVKRSPLPYLISITVLAAVVLVIVGAWAGEQAKIVSRRAELTKLQAELDSLKEIVDKCNELTEQEERLAAKIAIIHEIVSERIIWSRQLYNVSRLTPANVWYTSISEIEKPNKETRMVYNEKTKQEEPKTVTVRRRVLELCGCVIKGPDGSNDIAPLTFNTEQDPEFSQLFQLNSTRLQDTEYEGYKVRSFTLEYMINAGSKPV